MIKLSSLKDLANIFMFLPGIVGTYYDPRYLRKYFKT